MKPRTAGLTVTVVSAEVDWPLASVASKLKVRVAALSTLGARKLAVVESALISSTSGPSVYVQAVV
ncbi:MAG: hypothetical protein R3E09_17575 [Novosphingobium sp.]